MKKVFDIPGFFRYNVCCPIVRDYRLNVGDLLQLYINDEFFDAPTEDNAFLSVFRPELNIVNLLISRSRILSLRMRRASAVLAAMTSPPVFRSMRLHRAGVKEFSHRGVPEGQDPGGAPGGNRFCGGIFWKSPPLTGFLTLPGSKRVHPAPTFAQGRAEAKNRENGRKYVFERLDVAQGEGQDDQKSNDNDRDELKKNFH